MRGSLSWLGRRRVVMDGELVACGLGRKVDQGCEFLDQRLRFRVGAFGGLNGLMVLLVAEAHDLDAADIIRPRRPVFAGLLQYLELIAPHPQQSLAETAHEPGMMLATAGGDDVGVGLNEHCGSKSCAAIVPEAGSLFKPSANGRAAN